MTAVPVAEPMTAEQFLALPEPPGAQRRELVEGELVVNEPRPLHQHVLKDLMFALESWSRTDPTVGGVTLPLDVRLDERNVYAPDVLFYSGDRGPGRSETVPSPLPDLAVEIRSPSTWRYDIGAKKAGYERHGLAELWLVDNRRRGGAGLSKLTPRRAQLRHLSRARSHGGAHLTAAAGVHADPGRAVPAAAIEGGEFGAAGPLTGCADPYQRGLP